MRSISRAFAWCMLSWFTCLLAPSLSAQDPDSELNRVPESLREWVPWVLWDDVPRSVPSLYSDSAQRIPVWPSRLSLNANRDGGKWKVQVRMFSDGWLPLPGDAEHWPTDVLVNDAPTVVVEHRGVPSMFLTQGEYRLTGHLPWSELPQRLALPKAYGLLELTVADQPVPFPTWDTDGWLWLQRSSAAETESNQLTLNVYRVIEDGLPIWLRTQIDLTVSGKTREEVIGYVLPEQWQLSFVSSPIPVAIDESGQLKAQLRPGTWQIRIDAFRNQDLKDLQYAPGIAPAASTELIAVRGQPALRVVELQGGIPIDAQMTNFPEAWRDLSVFEWKTDTPLTWVEKSRGMGMQIPDKLGIGRLLWLDDDGRNLTFQDILKGQPKQIARLDVIDSHELGVVRIDGERQLITANPTTGSHGVELRTRNPTIEAIGRAPMSSAMLATGWKTDADSLHVTFYLPPGWRALAMLGADRVRGDWITAWSLLDLFLLLVFTIAVFRIWGWLPAAIAFVAFALSYHELGSPRLTWFFLLIPIAILKVLPKERHANWIQGWKWVAAAVLMINLVPFAAIQVQNAIYPQLEPIGIPYQSRTMFEWLHATYNTSAQVASVAIEQPLDIEQRFNAPGKVPPGSSNDLFSSGGARGAVLSKSIGSLPNQTQSQVANLQFEAGTRIQTGIAKPGWYGNQVHCDWDGPVDAGQHVQPILISCTQHRMLTAVRLGLLFALIGILFRSRARKPTLPVRAAPITAVVVSSCVFMATLGPVSAQTPDPDTLRLLRERLLQPSDAFPHAAEIPNMKVAIAQSQLRIEAQVHAAVDVAIPVPGKLPSWSPLRIQVDERPAEVCRRDDGYLWVWIPKGIHNVRVEGLLGDATEWVWTMVLPPRQLQVDAPDWNVTGLLPDGRPQEQMFFVRKEQSGDADASYDQKNFRSLVLVDRTLEIGLVWKVHTRIERISSPGKAISLQIPLLPGERVLTSNLVSGNGIIEVNLSADATSMIWESEIERTEAVVLTAPDNPQSVERWSLVSSPVWNIGFTGLQPMYESEREALVPAWRPWPGESVTIQIQRPLAVAGKTLTIKEAEQKLTLGNRQRTSRLRLQVESSLGGEFPLSIEEGVSITQLTLDNRPIPVRKQAAGIVVSLQPGIQTIEVEWTSENPLATVAAFPKIELPIEAANVGLKMTVPASRWILWTQGPIRGPAVRFWTILVLALLAAIVLGSAQGTPLKRWEWILLTVGLTQVNAFAALVVVAWLYATAWRSRTRLDGWNRWLAGLLQLFLVGLTLAAIGVLIVAVGKGLLGSPEMFIVGNGSFGGQLAWFEPLTSTRVPQPWIISISVWFYRLLILIWALWLANALLRWLQAWWLAMNHGGMGLPIRNPVPDTASVEPPPIL